MQCKGQSSEQEASHLRTEAVEGRGTRCDASLGKAHVGDKTACEGDQLWWQKVSIPTWVREGVLQMPRVLTAGW